MTTPEMLIDILSRSRERFDRAFDGVTVEQANTQPTPDLAPRIDSLTWLAWHTARELDTQVAPLAGIEPVWITGDHRERFALALPDDTEDWHHTPDQAAQVVVSDLGLLFAYLDDAYALATTYLRGLTPQVLDDVATAPGTRPSPGACVWPRSSTTPPSIPARPSTPAASWVCRASRTHHFSRPTGAHGPAASAPHVRPDLVVQVGANGSHMTRDCWGPCGPVAWEDRAAVLGRAPQAAGSTASPRRSTVTGLRSASVTTTSAHRPARSAPT